MKVLVVSVCMCETNDLNESWTLGVYVSKLSSEKSKSRNCQKVVEFKQL